MKYIIILLVSLSSQFLFCQQDAKAYQAVTKAFQENFNNQNIDGVFDLYTTETQNTMTREGITRFVNGCYKHFGKLNRISFTETAENVNTYNVVFDKMNLIMELQIDQNGKITTLQFQEP